MQQAEPQMVKRICRLKGGISELSNNNNKVLNHRIHEVFNQKHHQSKSPIVFQVYHSANIGWNHIKMRIQALSRGSTG